VVIRDDVVVCF